MADTTIALAASLDFYRDIVRKTNVHTLTMAATPSVTPFSYFGFIDVASDKSSYSEQNARYRLGRGPFQLSLQWVTGSGLPAQLARLGMLWKLEQSPVLQDVLSSIGVQALGINLHVLQLDTNFSSERGMKNFRQGGQIELAIAGAVCGTNLFYSGFLDQNFDYSGKDGMTITPVSDFQVGYKLLGNPGTTGALALSVEGRYNHNFRRLQDATPQLKNKPELSPFGLEVGLRYWGRL